MKWISIQNKLPEFNTPVLVCNNLEENKPNVCYLTSSSIYNDGDIKNQVRTDWNEADQHSEWWRDVTHWMHLPEPPSKSIPENATCKGSIALGTGCRKCSKCLKELQNQNS